MSDPAITFVFDENWSHKLVSSVCALLRAVGRPLDLRHIFDFFPSGVADDDWVPTFQPLNFVVVTADRARRYGGPKLPHLLKSHGITHVLLSKRLHHLKGLDKAICILKSVALLEGIKSAKRGSRYRWRYTNDIPTMPED